MITPAQKDILYNILIPVLAGCIYYLLPVQNNFQQMLRSYLPDALWAYAFFSCMLIIWQRQIQLVWLFTALLAMVFFEWLQRQHIISGTGDWADVLVYSIAATCTLLINKYFTLKFKSKSNQV